MKEAGVAVERLARAVLRWQPQDVYDLFDERRGLLLERAKLGSLPRGASYPAVSAFGSAALELMCKARHTPAFEYLAAESTPFNLEADPEDIPVNAVLGLESPEETAAEAAARAQEGYTTLKLKLGRDAAADQLRLRQVRDAVGADVQLRLDANGAWGVDEAHERLLALREFTPEFVEQPLPPGEGAVKAMRELERLTGVVVALDESLIFPFEAMHPLGALSIPTQDFVPGSSAAVVKPALLPLDEVLLYVVMSWYEEGPMVAVTTAFDTGIGTALAMHHAALLGFRRPACGLDTLRFLEGDIVTGVPAVEGGKVTLSNRPGLGVEIDEAALERYAAGPWRTVRS